MKGKTLKDAISLIPDDANVIFEYSNMIFGEQFDEVLITRKEDISTFAKEELFLDKEEANDLEKRADFIVHINN